jgi:hypothetical protein
MKTLSLSLAACVLLSTGVARAADKITTNDLKEIGLAYHSYFDKNKKGPAKADDLASFLDATNRKKLIDALKAEDVVFIYNVGILDMIDGTSNTLIAYVKDAPKDGGLVLYGDGSVKTMKADEFKKAILAKPKTKKDK